MPFKTVDEEVAPGLPVEAALPSGTIGFEIGLSTGAETMAGATDAGATTAGVETTLGAKDGVAKFGKLLT